MVGSALVLSDESREEAVARLTEHFARSHLDVEGFEDRLDLVQVAQSKAQLERIFKGLPSLQDETALQKRGPAATKVNALFSSTTRRGRFPVPERLQATARFGAVELDLSEAEILGAVTIEVSALFGSVVIIVPDGLAVEVDGEAVLGTFDQLEQAALSRRDRRRLTITGRALFGSVEVRVKKTRRGLLGALQGLFDERS